MKGSFGEISYLATTNLLYYDAMILKETDMWMFKR